MKQSEFYNKEENQQETTQLSQFYNVDGTPRNNNLKPTKMKTQNKLTLTEIVEQLNIWTDDLKWDIQNNVGDESDQVVMKMQHQQSLIAIANLEDILQDSDGQIFKSAFRK